MTILIDTILFQLVKFSKNEAPPIINGPSMWRYDCRKFRLVFVRTPVRFLLSEDDNVLQSHRSARGKPRGTDIHRMLQEDDDR